MYPSQIYRLPILTFIHLGFVLDSVSMTAPWPLVGINRLKLMCRSVEDIVTVLSVFLAQWSLFVQCHLLYAALQCFSEVAPGSISFCLLP